MGEKRLAIAAFVVKLGRGRRFVRVQTFLCVVDDEEGCANSLGGGGFGLKGAGPPSEEKGKGDSKRESGRKDQRELAAVSFIRVRRLDKE